MVNIENDDISDTVKKFQEAGCSNEEIKLKLRDMLFDTLLHMETLKNSKEGTENYNKYLEYAKKREIIKKEMAKFEISERRRK